MLVRQIIILNLYTLHCSNKHAAIMQCHSNKRNILSNKMNDTFYLWMGKKMDIGKKGLS